MKKSKFFEPLAVAVAGGLSIKAAAAIVNCAVSTAYAVSADDDFRRRVSQIRTEAVAGAVGRLSDMASRAVDTLGELLDASNDPPVRLNAAKAILGAVGPMAEFAELRARIDAIEATGPGLRVAR
jgi:hypothetical protein